jgi:hypothetical protein
MTNWRKGDDAMAFAIKVNGNTQMNATSSAAVESARPMTDAQLDQLSINCIDLLRPWLMSPVPASNWESTP